MQAALCLKEMVSNCCHTSFSEVISSGTVISSIYFNVKSASVNNPFELLILNA